nr:hypothetical protein [uncultured Agathobaculum sp.]
MSVILLFRKSAVLEISYSTVAIFMVYFGIKRFFYGMDRYIDMIRLLLSIFFHSRILIKTFFCNFYIRRLWRRRQKNSKYYSTLQESPRLPGGIIRSARTFFATVPGTQVGQAIFPCPKHEYFQRRHFDFHSVHLFHKAAVFV